MPAETRIDKWLWAVRIYKTRSEAANACKKGRVTIDEVQVKPSRNVKENEIVVVRKNPVNFSYKIKKNIDKRVAAKIAVECYEDITPQEEKDKLLNKKNNHFIIYDKGKGRPTKKDRRMIDKIKRSGF